MLLKAPLLLIFILGIAPYVVAQETPPLPHVEKQWCPTECCWYGSWKATSEAVAYSQPNEKSEVAFTIRKGEPVRGEGGFCETSKVGVMKILAPVQVGWTKRANLGERKRLLNLKPGDFIYTLNIQALGIMQFWYKGKVYEDQLDFKEALTILDPNPPRTAFEEQSRPTTVWWAEVSNKERKRGWVKEPIGFHGVDLCRGSLF